MLPGTSRFIPFTIGLINAYKLIDLQMITPFRLDQNIIEWK
jgi:hypothetical protein